MYMLNWFVRTTITAFLAVLGLAFLAMLMYPWPVAQYWWRGQRGYALGLVLSAAIGAALGAGAYTALLVGAVAALGAVAGHAMLQQWTFGRCVSVLTGMAFAILLLDNALHWPEVREEMVELSRSTTLRFEQLQAEQGESLQAQIDSSRWLLEHLDYVAFGSLFGGALFMCIAAVSLLNWNARRQGLALKGRFATMRPPDALVWVAIAVALAAFMDYQWPNGMVRLLAWNTGTALAAVYWLNGLACMVYLATTLQLNMFFVIALVVMLVMPAAMPLLTLLGFFDTWLELRKRVDKLAAFRQKIISEHGND